MRIGLIGSMLSFIIYCLCSVEEHQCSSCGNTCDEQELMPDELSKVHSLERELGNCDFKKVYCPKCNSTDILRKRHRNTKECPKCGWYTMEKHEITTSDATTNEGPTLVEETCRNCNHRSSCSIFTNPPKSEKRRSRERPYSW